jgi:hypothetical protein
MEISCQDAKELEQLEEDLWRSEVRFDLKRMAEILAPDFIEFGRSSRVYTKADTLAVPSQPINAEHPLADFKVRLLDTNIAQVTYISVVTDENKIQRALRSSIWSRTQDGWKLRFHQGTAIEVAD